MECAGSLGCRNSCGETDLGSVVGRASGYTDEVVWGFEGEVTVSFTWLRKCKKQTFMSSLCSSFRSIG